MGKATREWETERRAKETGSHANNVTTTFNSDPSPIDNKTAMPHDPNSKLPKLVAQEDIYKVKPDVFENRLCGDAKHKEEVKKCAESLKQVGDQLEIDYLRRNLIGLNLEGLQDPPPDPGAPATKRPHSARK
ncbi:Hypp5106 [Branchiostoma lanceolatum]|uniref:Hypp5106 protein n=1 Tax=Branchiostoma lanceolatum TaxID=7740 RepID=A0A8K0AER4_BRALA|nr:Hypp5106 [Branchiostoma lanceolatum]